MQPILITLLVYLLVKSFLAVSFILAAALILSYVLKLYYTRQVIADADGQPYLIRYFIYKPKSEKRGRIYLHHIVRSDHDRSLHCHPWIFSSFIIWGGYYEVTDVATPGFILCGADIYMRRFRPLSLIRRPAEWRHRLVLPEGKTAWTLVNTSPKLRSWGFWPNGKFCPWRKYDTSTGLCDD